MGNQLLISVRLRYKIDEHVYYNGHNVLADGNAVPSDISDAQVTPVTTYWGILNLPGCPTS